MHQILLYSAFLIINNLYQVIIVEPGIVLYNTDENNSIVFSPNHENSLFAILNEDTPVFEKDEFSIFSNTSTRLSNKETNKLHGVNNIQFANYNVYFFPNFLILSLIDIPPPFYF